MVCKDWTLLNKIHRICILLDYSLPGYNGIDILYIIQKDFGFIPVIMLTGQGNEAIAVQAIKAGAQNYLVKANISPQSLHLAITTAIEHAILNNKVVTQDRELKDRESRLSSILDNTADGFLTMDKYGSLESYNKACKSFFNYDCSEVIGKNIDLLIPPDTNSHFFSSTKIFSPM